MKRLARRGLVHLGLRRPGAGETSFRRQILVDGGSLPAGPLASTWRAWPNTALRSSADVDRSVATLRDAGLVPHQDRPKNWDALVALGTILDAVPRTEPILEMGATPYSPLLRWLYQYGYRSLTGIDLVYERPMRRGPIRLLPMDLTATSFPDASFGAIACLSVIEHGVDVGDYVRESARLLRPGGVLITSTDYWPEAVETAGREAFGTAVRLFDRPAVEDLVSAGAQAGLRVSGRLDLDATERVVRWERVDLDFTFCVIVMNRPAPEGGGRSSLRGRTDGHERGGGSPE